MRANSTLSLSKKAIVPKETPPASCMIFAV